MFWNKSSVRSEPLEERGYRLEPQGTRMLKGLRVACAGGCPGGLASGGENVWLDQHERDEVTGSGAGCPAAGRAAWSWMWGASQAGL